MRDIRPVARVLPSRAFFLLLAIALVMAPGLQAFDPSVDPLEMSDVGGTSLQAVQQREAREASRDGRFKLEPGVADEVGTSPAPAAVPPPVDTEYDIAVLPFRNIANKERSGLIYAKIQEYLRKKGLSVVSRPVVDKAIRNLGVLSTEAITIQDSAQLAIDLKARFLICGAAKVPRADTNFSPIGAIVSGARVLVGGFSGAAAAAGLPFLVGGLAFSLVAGFSNTASAELECRIYDVNKRKIIWVGSESAQRRKDFLAVFSNKKKLENQALERGISKLFDPIVPKLAARKKRTPIAD